MNPGDLMLLTIPAAAAAFKLALMSMAVVLVVKGLLKPFRLAQNA